MSARVVINGTILNRGAKTGLGVYTTSILPLLIPGLAADNRVAEIVVVGDQHQLKAELDSALDSPKLRVASVTTTNPYRRVLELNRLVRRERAHGDHLVFYSPTHHGVSQRDIRQLITVHDLFARLFPRNYPAQYLYFRWYLPRVLASSDGVMVDSSATATDLRRFYRRCPPTVVVYAAARADLATIAPESVSELAGENYFLFVGPTFWYKNAPRLIDAFALYRRGHPGRLVFVGGRPEYVETLRRHLERRHRELAPDVIFLGYASVGELAWLYRHATALMITTLYEGFGLPALEAMVCECPVVASRAGSLPEICGAAALFVDPMSTDEIAGAMVTIADKPEVRARLVEEGRHQWRHFSWQATAESIYRAISDLI